MKAQLVVVLLCSFFLCGHSLGSKCEKLHRLCHFALENAKINYCENQRQICIENEPPLQCNGKAMSCEYTGIEETEACSIDDECQRFCTEYLECGLAQLTGG